MHPEQRAFVFDGLAPAQGTASVSRAAFIERSWTVHHEPIAAVASFVVGGRAGPPVPARRTTMKIRTTIRAGGAGTRDYAGNHNPTRMGSKRGTRRRDG